jgi:hypothetical protein
MKEASQNPFVIERRILAAYFRAVSDQTFWHVLQRKIRVRETTGGGLVSIGGVSDA